MNRRQAKKINKKYGHWEPYPCHGSSEVYYYTTGNLKWDRAMWPKLHKLRDGVYWYKIWEPDISP
jgi:hypothetical protein